MYIKASLLFDLWLYGHKCVDKTLSSKWLKTFLTYINGFLNAYHSDMMVAWYCIAGMFDRVNQMFGELSSQNWLPKKSLANG